MFEVQIPKRALIFMGPQRCGKTTAYTSLMNLCATDDRRMLMIGSPGETHDYAVIARLELFTNPVSYRSPESAGPWPNPEDFDAIFVVGNSVFHEPGRISMYKEPSTQYREFMQRLAEIKGPVPYVFVEAHYEGTENDVAQH